MSVILPIEFTGSIDLFSLNDKLKNLRSDLALISSQITSGAFSIKRSMSDKIEEFRDICSEILSKIEVLIIPKESFADFEAGLVTLDEFGSFDLLEYYNGIKKLRFISHGLDVALILVSESKEIPLQPKNTSAQGILNSLDEDEFADQGFDNPVQELEQVFTYYTVIQGDTLQGIAVKMYQGDYTRWTEIASANDLSDSDLLDGSQIGNTIKIPVTGSSSFGRSSTNLVFEATFNGTNQADIDKFLYGRDIEVVKGKIQIDGTGDIRLIAGAAGVVQNVTARFDSTKGSLNPLHPNWGLLPYLDTGQMPFFIMIEKVIVDMEAQAASDPRVISATANRRKARLVGNALYISITMRMIGGNSENLRDVTVPLFK